jgi:hypothetical protein
MGGHITREDGVVPARTLVLATAAATAGLIASLAAHRWAAVVVASLVLVAGLVGVSRRRKVRNGSQVAR